MSSFLQIWDSVTTMSGQVDMLFLFLIGISGLATAAIFFGIIFFSIKYRKRPGHEISSPVRQTKFIEAFMIGIPLIIFMGIFLWGAELYYKARVMPDNTLQIYGTAKQWMWKFQNPNGKREINELHVPVGQTVQVTLISQDVIHSFYVPAFRVKMDVLPKRYTDVWFKAEKPGEYRLLCAEYCGLGHSRMRAKVYAMSPADYADWLQTGGRSGLYEGSRGEKLFQQFSCVKCHENPSIVPAPSLKGLYNSQVQLSDGRTITADEKYIRESIMYPAKDIVNGYHNVMPSFQNQLTETQIVDLILYIKSLSGKDLDFSRSGEKDKQHD